MEKLTSKAFAEARIIVRNKILEMKGLDYATLDESEKQKINEMVDHKDVLIQELAEKRLARLTSSLNESFTNKFTKKKEEPKSAKKAGKPPIEQHSKFSDEMAENTSLYKGLIKKSEKSGIAIETLGEVFNRGWDSWNESVSVSQQQYAFARVNSFINQGKTYFNEDSDLAESKNQPYVKPHFGGLQDHQKQTGWKSSNKHGKVKFFGLEFKKSALKHAGLTEEVETLDEDFKKGQTVFVTQENPNVRRTPHTGRIHKIGDNFVELRTPGHGTGYYKVKKEHLSAEKHDSWFHKKYSNVNEEEVNELSKGLLARYIKRSAEDMANSQGQGVSMDQMAKRQPHSKDKPFLQAKADEKWNKVRKRKDGISMAVVKIAEEQIDEKNGNVKSTVDDREDGSSSVVKIYKKDTPGETVKEDVKVADKVPVLVPAHTDQYGNTIPAQTVMRKTGKKIISSGNVHDGKD